MTLDFSWPMPLYVLLGVVLFYLLVIPKPIRVVREPYTGPLTPSTRRLIKRCEDVVADAALDAATLEEIAALHAERELYSYKNLRRAGWTRKMSALHLGYAEMVNFSWWRLRKDIALVPLDRLPDLPPIPKDLGDRIRERANPDFRPPPPVDDVEQFVGVLEQLFSAAQGAGTEQEKLAELSRLTKELDGLLAEPRKIKDLVDHLGSEPGIEAWIQARRVELPASGPSDALARARAKLDSLRTIMLSLHAAAQPPPTPSPQPELSAEEKLARAIQDLKSEYAIRAEGAKAIEAIRLEMEGRGVPAAKITTEVNRLERILEAKIADIFRGT